MKRSEMLKKLDFFLMTGTIRLDNDWTDTLASDVLSFLEKEGMLPPYDTSRHGVPITLEAFREYHSWEEE